MINPFVNYTDQGLEDYDTDLRVWALEFDRNGGIYPDWYKNERTDLDDEIEYRGLDFSPKPFT